MFGIASLGARAGMSQEGFPISPEHRGSSASAGGSSEFHGYQFLPEIHLQESVWREMWNKLGVELRIWERSAELL